MPSGQGVMNLALRNDDQAITFLPVEEFVFILEKIPQDGQVRRLPWIGVGAFQPLSDVERQANNVQTPAVRIDRVIPGHAAESAGLQNRDIITGLEGNPLEALGSPDLVARNLERDLYRRSVGETVSLTIQRDSQRRTVSLTLEPMPKLPGEAPRFYHRQLGVVLREKVMLDRYLDKGPTANVDGMLVENVTRSGPAHQAGLQQGDVVTAVNGRPVTTAEGLKQIVDAATSQSPPQELRMDIQRGTATQTVVVRPPRS
jgi:S1-C subfamily serine protease